MDDLGFLFLSLLDMLHFYLFKIKSLGVPRCDLADVNRAFTIPKFFKHKIETYLVSVFRIIEPNN